MKITDLEPQFVRLEFPVETWTRVTPDGGTEEVTGPREHHVHVDSLAEAQGVRFLCPKCFNEVDEHAHMVLCWFRDRDVPDDAQPGPGRWNASGTGYGDLSLSPSVALTSGCMWHGHVQAGSAVPA
jgi:hypothetical protein